MSNLAINLRSTSGGGKSTTVRTILTAYNAQPILDGNGKVCDYQIAACPDLGGKPLFVLGKYITATGGCDTVKTQDEVCDRVRKYIQRGNVLFEGLLISGLFDRYSKLADELQADGHKLIIGFLDTPLEQCVANTNKRREAAAQAKGKVAKEFDWEKTLAPKFRAILSARRKFEAAGKDVRNLPWGDTAPATVAQWLLPAA